MRDEVCERLWTEVCDGPQRARMEARAEAALAGVCDDMFV